MKFNQRLLTIIAIVALFSISLTGLPITARTVSAVSDPTNKTKTPLDTIKKGDGSVSEKSLETVIDASGRIKEGVEGSFDAAGFKMVLGKNNEPTFVRDDAPDGGQSLVGDAAWDARFSVNGITGSVVQTIVKDASGNLYIGGQFDAVGTVLAKNIAKWDGSRWSAMGTGADAYVAAIVPYGTDIYVAGNFNNAGGVAADGIAKWSNTSSSWSALTGGGLTRPAATSNDGVAAMIIRGQDIYVGGNFTHAGGILVNRIARYNISTNIWHALGSGVTHSTESSPGVRGLGFDSNGILYVAGLITSAGGVTANVIAKWDGSNWSAVGNTTWGGSPPFAQTLAVSGTDVYVGGRFSMAGGVAANNIARWDGSSWSALGSGANSLVSGINVFQGTVYVVGDFTSAGGNSNFKYSAKWNTGTSTWSSFATNLNSTTYAIYIDNTDTYIGGYFTTAGNSVAVGLAKWNGTEFEPLFRGAFGSSRYVGRIAISGTNMYVTGTFTAIGDVAAKYIARWDGSRWWPLKDASLPENGTSGISYALATSGNMLYVGGTTYQGDPVAGRYVAMWNNATSTWSSIPGSENRTGLGGIGAVAVSGNDLYVGGTFLTIGGVANTRGIARWDGSNWHALSTGITGPMTYPGVYSIAVKDSSNIFVGGHFGDAGGIVTAGIARWNPSNSTWSALGAGLSGGSVVVYTIHLAANGDVYVGGGFTTAGATTVNNVAKWTPGSPGSWSALGAGVNSTVNAIQVTSNGDVYVGGVFTTAGGNAATYIARYSGGNWSTLGSGLNDGVADLRVDGSTLWVAGSFTRAGNVVAGRITRYYISNFNGSFGGNWHTPGSWQSNAVPTSTDDAVISDADVSVTDSDAVVRDLQIGDGRTLTIANGRTLTVHGKLIVQGQILGDGEIEVLTCDPDAILFYNGAYLKSTVSRCVNPSASYTFPVGTDNSYSPVVLSNITSTKMVTVRANQGAYQNAPARLPQNRLPRWWYINAYDLPALWESGSGVQTFSTDLRFYYKAGEVAAGDSGAYKAWRLSGGSGGTAQNMGGSNDLATSSLLVQGISQFSDWTLAVGRATAAPAAIEGRVFDATGRPVANASVLITKPDGETVTVKTNNFGRYRFAGIIAGETYLVMAQTRWNLYMPQVVTTSNDLAEIDFRP